MHRWYPERTPVRLLLLMALLVISIIPLLPLHTAHAAHAAPQRPLSGCTGNNYYYQPFVFSGISNFFGDRQYYTCSYPNLVDDTWFEVTSGGNVPYIVAQGDTWITQLPQPGGTRYGETGRSNQVAYPNNGVEYFVQEAYVQVDLGPAYGCNWVNWPKLGQSHDYTCLLMH